MRISRDVKLPSATVLISLLKVYLMLASLHLGLCSATYDTPETFAVASEADFESYFSDDDGSGSDYNSDICPEGDFRHSSTDTLSIQSRVDRDNVHSTWLPDHFPDVQIQWPLSNTRDKIYQDS